MSEPPEISFSAKKLRQHWVCHFSFHDGPLDGLVEITGHYFYAKTHRCGSRYSLWPIVLTEECQRWLEDYRSSYHHTFYEDGIRPAYDGRPLAWFSEKWPVNPIREMMKERTA